MSRPPGERIADILTALDRCSTYRPYLERPEGEFAVMAYDAVLRNLAVVGEAVRALPPEVTTEYPDVPWQAIAGLRNVIVHEYFRVRPDLILDILDTELAPLAAALRERRR